MMRKKYMKLAIPFVLVVGMYGCSGDEAPPVTSDTTPPTVVSTSPADGETNVPIDTDISVTFSEDMDRWTLSTATFVVSGTAGGTILYGNNTATLQPTGDLIFSQDYTVVITTDVTDVAGNNLESNYTWSFTTTAGAIMPLAVGNQWEFLAEVIDTLTGQIDSTLEIVSIVRDTLIQTEQWFIDGSGEVYTNRIEGLWGLSQGGQPYLFLKFPATIGDSYFGNPDLVETIRVDSTATLRSVPHGFHICYLYTGTVFDPTIKYKYYYKPNFGPVAVEKVVASGARVIERRSLIRLTLQ
jgi:hypothetical protein